MTTSPPFFWAWTTPLAPMAKAADTARVNKVLLSMDVSSPV
jgi:hypothetical protein